MDEEDQIE
jgi:Ran GTPase-activating protein (RanGAP) involved in mRNA processing and transport